jgi:hypothetical protein
VANKGGSASYRISLPAGITEVSIRVAGEEVFSKHGSTIQTQAKADASGSYHLPF